MESLVLINHLEEALKFYATSDAMPLLLEAKAEYQEKTGKIDEDDADYESSINAFHDWYLLQFLSKKRTLTLIKEYALERNLSNEFIFAFQNLNHSIFAYNGKDKRGNQILKDVLHNRKLTLPMKHPLIGMVKGDFFLGRTLSLRGEIVLCHGCLVLPKEVNQYMSKICVQLRKERDRPLEQRFLLDVERLRNRVKNFAHVGALNIFKQGISL